MRSLRPSALRRLARDRRGATLVEYALLLSLSVAAAVPVLRPLGRHVNEAFAAVSAQFAQ